MNNKMTILLFFYRIAKAITEFSEDDIKNFNISKNNLRFYKKTVKIIEKFLFKKYKNLISKIISSYNAMLDAQEIMQLAYIGFYKALKKYNPCIAKFETCATQWIKAEILNHIKKIKPVISLNNNFSEENEDEYINLLKYEIDEDVIDLKLMLNELPILEKNIITDFYIQEKSINEISLNYDINTENVLTILNNALNKLKNNLVNKI